MRLTRQIVIQLLIFSMLAVVALGIMVFSYMRLPAILGIGVYRVTWTCRKRAGFTRAETSPIAAPRSAS